MDKRNIQMVWGTALLLMGIGVFFRVPKVMAQLGELPQFAGVSGFLRFCMYFIGVILAGGGIRKFVLFSRKNGPEDQA
ncbi:MAG: hypothetical protein CSA22_02320 [Deltaproteobacteria bacterium]|nr:MAG: hypothetical protein CSA22_02320 [Deltaproteobacteria bacterium]